MRKSYARKFLGRVEAAGKQSVDAAPDLESEVGRRGGGIERRILGIGGGSTPIFDARLQAEAGERAPRTRRHAINIAGSVRQCITQKGNRDAVDGTLFQKGERTHAVGRTNRVCTERQIGPNCKTRFEPLLVI